MLKYILILTLSFLSNYNALFSQLTFDFILGAKLQTDRMEDVNFASPAKVITALHTGIEIGHSKLSQFNLSYQRSYWKNFTNYIGPNPSAIEEFGPILELWEEDQVHLYFNFNTSRIGIGHYWRKRESNVHFFFPDILPQLSRGLQASYTISTCWLDIELRTKVKYDPSFAALTSSAHYALLITKRIGFRKKEFKKLPNLKINGLIGLRSFLIDVELIPGEVLNKPIAIAPLLGLEFYFPRFNTSINIEKDWWNSFNGGSTVRPVKGLVYSSYIGIMYHQKLKNNRMLRYGIGGSWIEDNENKLDNITLNPTPEQQKLGNYQVKGIGLKVSYEILPKLDLEVKTTLPLVGEEIFESPSRTSIGLIYRYNPISDN